MMKTVMENASFLTLVEIDLLQAENTWKDFQLRGDFYLIF